MRLGRGGGGPGSQLDDCETPMTLHDHRFTTARESGRAIVEALGGVWRNDGGMCRCPAHGDRTPVAERAPGPQAAAIPLFRWMRDTRDPRRAAGIAPGGIGSAGRRSRSIVSADDRSGRRAAQHLWSESRAGDGSPVARYLAARALAPTSALRFHPRTPLGQKAAHTLRACDDRVRHRCHGPDRRPPLLPVE